MVELQDLLMHHNAILFLTILNIGQIHYSEFSCILHTNQQCLGCVHPVKSTYFRFNKFGCIYCYKAEIVFLGPFLKPLV